MVENSGIRNVEKRFDNGYHEAILWPLLSDLFLPGLDPGFHIIVGDWPSVQRILNTSLNRAVE